LREQILARQAGLAAQTVEGARAQGIGETVRRDLAVGAVADPRANHVAETAPLEALDQAVEPVGGGAASVIRLTVEPGIGAASGRTAAGGTPAGTVEHAGKVAEIAAEVVAGLTCLRRRPAAAALVEPAEIAVVFARAGEGSAAGFR